jgi:hypothetical protein
MGVSLSVYTLVLFSVQGNTAFSLGNMGGKASKQTLKAAALEQPRVPVPAASVVATAGSKQNPSPDVHDVGPDSASTASAGAVSAAVAAALRETRTQTPEPSQDTAESTNTTEGAESALLESIKSTNDVNTSNTTKAKKNKMQKRVKVPKGPKPLKRVLDARPFLSYRTLHYPDLTPQISNLSSFTSHSHLHTSHLTPQHLTPFTFTPVAER